MSGEAGMNVQRLPQVSSGTYRRKYLSLVRLITHWYQAHLVADQVPVGASVLEVGPGAGHTTWLLRNFGLKPTTLDFDPALQPDIVGDVTELDCADKSYDCVLCAEVLEHIPFVELPKALRELRRVARQAVVISVPAPLVGFSLMLNITGLAHRGLSVGLPYWVPHRFDGEHYWEIGKRGYSLNSVKQVMRECGFEVRRAFRPAPSLYAYFFVLVPLPGPEQPGT
jgi:hypothetical protein